MVLFDNIVQVFHAPECAILRQHLFVLRYGERIRISSILIDWDCERKSAMTGSHHFTKESFCSRNITFCTQHEFDSLPRLIDRTIQKLTGLPDFDVGLIHPIGRAAHLQMRTDSFVYFRSVSLYSPKHGRVIHRKPALTHHLFDITVRKLIAKIPADTQQNEFRLEVRPLEIGFFTLHEQVSREFEW